MSVLLRRDERLFLALVLASVALIAAIVGGNLLDVLYPSSPSGPKIDVGKVLKGIEKAGLEPKEARYYEVLGEGE